MKIEKGMTNPLTFAETRRGEVYRMRFRDSTYPDGYIVMVHKSAPSAASARIPDFVIDLGDGFVWTHLANAAFYPVTATLRVSE